MREYLSICGDRMKIDDESKLSTITAEGWAKNTCYGNIPINDKYDCIYSWTLRRIGENGYRVEIGIASDKQRFNEGFTYRQNYCVVWLSFSFQV